MYSVQILTKYLNFLLKKKKRRRINEGISASVSSSQGQEWGGNLFKERIKKMKHCEGHCHFFSRHKCPKINKQENVPSHNHYT